VRRLANLDLKGRFDMMRKLALAIAFCFAVPAAALACHDKQEQVKTTTDGQQILLAQADTSKPTTSKKKAKKAPKKAPKKDTTK
jgi:hypothetical protein